MRLLSHTPAHTTLVNPYLRFEKHGPKHPRLVWKYGQISELVNVLF